jgi:hypothetical protein
MNRCAWPTANAGRAFTDNEVVESHSAWWMPGAAPLIGLIVAPSGAAKYEI